MASMYMSSLPMLYTNLLKYVVLSFQERQDLLDAAQNDINMETMLGRMTTMRMWCFQCPHLEKKAFSLAMPEAKPCFSKFSWIP